MPRPMTWMLSVVALLILSPGLRAEDQPKDVLARAIKAHGGEELLTKYKATQAKNKGKINIPAAGEVEFTQEVSAMQPDKFKESIEMKVGDQNLKVVSLVNGDKLTIEANGKEIKLDDKMKGSLKDAGHLMTVARLTPLLKDKKYELSLIGEDKVEEKPAIGIRVVTKGQKDVNLFFDKKTNLLVKLEHRTNDPFTGNEITQERIILEYSKNKDGMPVPKKVVIRNDTKTFLEVEVLEITHLEKLDDSEFQK